MWVVYSTSPSSSSVAIVGRIASLNVIQCNTSTHICVTPCRFNCFACLEEVEEAAEYRTHIQPVWQIKGRMVSSDKWKHHQATGKRIADSKQRKNNEKHESLLMEPGSPPSFLIQRGKIEETSIRNHAIFLSLRVNKSFSNHRNFSCELPSY